MIMRKIIKQYSNLFEVDLPIINELIKTKELKRLKDISYHCGMYYGPKDIYSFRECYTRLDHSINGSHMYYLLTNDIKGAVAFLFHDISTPVFSHVIDIMEGDPINQEITEKYNKEIIRNSKEIRKILDKYKIDIEEVLDAKDYSVADNKRPKLCIDRLDAVFIEALLWEKCASINDIKELFNDISVFSYEDQKEIGFKNQKNALKFFDYTMKSAYLTDDYADTFAMAYLAKIIKVFIDNNIIKEKDLYLLKEKQMIRKLKYHKLTKGLWKEFVNLQRNDIKTSNKKIKNYEFFTTDSKRRYIDPLVKCDKVKRITEVCYECKNIIDKYLTQDRKKYVYNKKISKNNA